MSFGATAEDRKAFNQMMQDPENKRCVDCSAPNPQWANIHHGVFICLECAGTHRGLGTHLSFVRSITMDKWKDWKPEKLVQMQKGGNGNALVFFKAKAVPGGTQKEIRARYNHIGAWMYRSKLEATVEGKPWSEANFQAPPEYNPDWDKPREVPKRAGYTSNRMGGMGSSPPPSSNDKSTIDEGVKAMSAGIGKLQAVGWTVGSALADAGKKAGKSVADTTKSVDTTSVQKTAEEGWKSAAAGASVGWGWLSSTVQKAASSAADMVGTTGGDDDGFGKIRSNLAHGPVGEGDTIVAGETVVWESPQGSQKVTVSAVDDRTDPPTYVLKLEDGAKRCAGHKQLRKWATFQAESNSPSTEEAPPAAPSQSSASVASPASPAKKSAPAAPAPRQANPFAASNSSSPKPAAPAKKNDDWDDWGDDDSWGNSKKDD